MNLDPAENSIRVLLIYDNRADAQVILHTLQQAGVAVQVRQAESEDAFRRQLTPDLDVILCNYQLPQFDALRALAFVQERYPDLPFLIVSGSIGEETAVHAIKQGATDYLRKDRLGRRRRYRPEKSAIGRWPKAFRSSSG